MDAMAAHGEDGHPAVAGSLYQRFTRPPVCFLTSSAFPHSIPAIFLARLFLASRSAWRRIMMR